MTEFLFYHLQVQPVEKVLPVLLEKSVERGWRAVVHTSLEERVDTLDAYLWTFRDDSFLPHGTFREPTAADQPVLLTVRDHNPNAATVRFLLDGTPVKSCTVLAVQADGAKVTTVEGLEQGGKLHPVQEGFTEKHGLQCGYCTPGMMMTSVALLERNKNPSEQEIREAIAGNLCRCTGYVNIVKAVQYAAEKMR